MRTIYAPFLVLALRACVSRSRLGEASGLGVLEGEIIRSMCQISTLGGQRTEIFLAILRFVTFCDITLSPHASRLEQVEACGISTCRNSALSGTVPEISVTSRFVTFFVITLGPRASRSKLAEACGLDITWAMVRAIYVPKFSSLSGTVSEISANVT